MDHETVIHEKIVPVGFPIQDKEIVLLDDAGHPVTAGGVGEIAIKSHYLTLGYWGQPELTQSSFQPAPGNDEKRIYRTGDLARFLPDGCLVHLGRKDFQVKVRGYRVEVGEIENTFLEMDSIEKAIVHAQKKPSGEQRLVAYLVSSSSPPPSVGTLRRALSKTPPRIHDSLRLRDAARLAAHGHGQSGPWGTSKAGKGSGQNWKFLYVAPRTPIEREMSQIWSELLGLESVGVNDPFIELGGDSLRATQLISRVLDRF